MSEKDDVFVVGDKEYTSRFFHCFGEKDTKLNLNLATDIIKMSETQFIVFNTHNIKNIKNKGELPLGFSSITLSQLSKKIDHSKYTLLNNINQARSCEEAVERTILSSKISGSKFIKLEVLNNDLKTSNDVEVLKAAKILINKGYKVMALISCNFESAKKLEEMGCSLIRIMGSPIGSQKGLTDKKTAKKIFKELETSVIVDGGIGNPKHVLEIMKLGASGVLVNNCLYSSKNPVLMIEAIKHALIAGRKWYLESQI